LQTANLYESEDLQFAELVFLSCFGVLLRSGRVLVNLTRDSSLQSLSGKEPFLGLSYNYQNVPSASTFRSPCLWLMMQRRNFGEWVKASVNGFSGVMEMPHGLLLHLIPLSLSPCMPSRPVSPSVETLSLAPSLLLSLYLLLQLLNMRHDLPKLPRPIHHI
jgi:hypothetical protein